jgi:phospholipase/carboxylesterase
MAVAPDPEAMIWSGPPDRRADGSLVLLLHGAGGVAQDMTPFFTALPAGAVGVSIRGPVALRDRWAWFDPGYPSSADLDAATAGLLGWLRSLRGYSRVGAVGFSQGGALAVQLLRHQPGSLGFAVQLCAFVMPDEHPGDRDLAGVRPPVLSITGGRDDVVADLHRGSRRWLRAHTDLTEIRHPALGHEINDQVIGDTARYLAERIR